MIDLTEAKPSRHVVEVVPSNNIFQELGNNTYDFLDLVSELVDNSVAARVEDALLEVEVTIGLSDQRERSFFIVTDNASGISRKRLGEAISPAALQSKDSLNEHGLGMKQAVASLGKLQYLLTKTEKDREATVIEEFKFGKLESKVINVPWKHGTEIKVVRLRPIVPMNQNHYTRDIVKCTAPR